MFSLSDEKDVLLVQQHCHICPWKVVEPSGFFFFFVAVYFGAVFSLLDKKDAHLIDSNLLLVCQILTMKFAVMWGVILCGVLDKN